MDRRRESRKSTQESVRVRIGSRTLHCRMRNLSRSGCMVESPALLVEVGAPIEVVLGPDVVAQGEVAWQLGESFGVLFQVPVPASVVEEYSIAGWPLASDPQHDQAGRNKKI